MRLIVCDTGPILHLTEASLLELIQKSGKVYTPRMVDIEMNELYPLCQKQKPEWFITDDTGARIFASSLGMEVHGSLGIALSSAAEGHLNYIESLGSLDRLSKTSLWISKEIFQQHKGH
jgi:predicted nucleic acid-binding protein